MLTKVTSQDDEVDSDIEVSAGSQGQKKSLEFKYFPLEPRHWEWPHWQDKLLWRFSTCMEKWHFFFGGFHSRMCGKAGTTVVGTMDVDEEESSGDSPRTGEFMKSWNSKKTTSF